MKLALVSLAAAAAGLAACTDYPPPPPPGPPLPPLASGASLPTGQCFRSSEIRNHAVGDDRTLYINVRGREYYRVAMSGACLAGAISSDPIILRSPPGSQIVCRPIDLDISVSKGGFASPCIVDGIERMTPEQVAALPPRLRP